MSRSSRRHFEKAFPKILKQAGGRCGLCGHPFDNNTNLFGGFSRGNQVVLTGECCHSTLFSVLATGTYSLGNTPSIHMPVASVVPEQQIESWVPPEEPLLPSPAAVETAPWKADDTSWFSNNPPRSHRLRPGYDAELAAIPAAVKPVQTPEHHRWEMLVRQVGKGRCIRLAFCRDTQALIPDVEEVIQEIFDAVSRPGASGFIQAEEIIEITSRYSQATQAAMA